MASTELEAPRVRLASMQHRVLIYLTCYNVLDGVTLTIRKLEQEILAAGHHVCILTTLSGDLNNTHLDGEHPNRQVQFLDNAVPIPFLNDSERPELSYKLGFSLSAATKQKIDDFEPSIIHLTVPDCTSLHVIQYARKKEIPIMGTYHSNIPEYMEHYPGLSWLKHLLGAFFRHQYNYLQALYVPTPFIKQHLIDSYKMDRVTTLNVWGRGVDVDKFNPAYRSMDYRSKLGIPHDATVVLWVGRLVNEKRPDIFGNVVRRLHAKGVNFHALVVGAGVGEEEIKKLPNTTFAGWMSADQLAIAYASSDVFLFPSAVETFGNVTLEAAASGLPVVVEAGCSGHLVREGENGFTAQSGDEDAFFEATLSLVEDAQMRREFSTCSREIALSLEKSSVVRQMLANYSSVSDEFYSEYSGHHSSRDAAYTQSDSFSFGVYPRPLVYIIVESVFVAVFILLWKVSCVVAFVSSCLARPGRNEKSSSVPAPPLSSPNRVKKAKQAAIDLKVSPTNLSVVELDDLEIGKSDKDPLLSDDDNTATTGSSSATSSAKSLQSFGDCRLSHTLCKGFVKTIQVQCRIESNIRQGVTSCCSSTGRQFVGVSKRKNSSIGIAVSALHGPDALLMRSRSDDADDGVSPHGLEDPTLQSATGMQRPMRRLQSGSVLQVY